MNSIYEMHDKAFANVSAYVVLDKRGEKVATVAFKFPADGAGRLWAYVHWLGVPMVRGYAGGYGYDKRSAAVENAARKIEKVNGPESVPDTHGDLIAERARLRRVQEAQSAFIRAIDKDSGEYWDRRLQDAGFTVLQAV